MDSGELNLQYSMSAIKDILKVTCDMFEKSGFLAQSIEDESYRTVFVIMTFVERFEDGGFASYLTSPYGNCSELLASSWHKIGSESIGYCVAKILKTIPSELSSNQWWEREDYFITNEIKCERITSACDDMLRSLYTETYGNAIELRFENLHYKLYDLIDKNGSVKNGTNLAT